MARPIYQIQPQTQGGKQGVGVLLPMNKSAHANNPALNGMLGQSNLLAQSYSGSYGGGGVFAQSFSTEEQALSNLKNLLLTIRGERYMQPTFGTRIREAVFQPNTENLVEFIQETITESINRWLPYINLHGIDVVRNVDDHTFTIKIIFNVTEIGANRVIVLLATEESISVIANEELTTGLTEVGTFGDVFASGGY